MLDVQTDAPHSHWTCTHIRTDVLHSHWMCTFQPMDFLPLCCQPLCLLQLQPYIEQIINEKDCFLIFNHHHPSDRDTNNLHDLIWSVLPTTWMHNCSLDLAHATSEFDYAWSKYLYFSIYHYKHMDNSVYKCFPTISSEWRITTVSRHNWLIDHANSCIYSDLFTQSQTCSFSLVNRDALFIINIYLCNRVLGIKYFRWTVCIYTADWHQQVCDRMVCTKCHSFVLTRTKSLSRKTAKQGMMENND